LEFEISTSANSKNVWVHVWVSSSKITPQLPKEAFPAIVVVIIIIGGGSGSSSSSSSSSSSFFFIFYSSPLLKTERLKSVSSLMFLIQQILLSASRI